MRVPTKGSLFDTTFIDILKQAATANLTGMVRLEKGTIIKVVYLQSGAIAFASSNEKADRLTEVLKSAGKLTPEQVEDAQARLKPNVSLGKTLVELGYISARDLLWGARAQVDGSLHKLLFWKDGSYQVLEGPLPKEIISLNLSVAQVIYEGILTTKDREWLLNEIGSPEAVYSLSSDFHEKNAVYKLQADSVVSLLDGKRSLEEIAQQSGLDTFETCKTAAGLQILGLIEKAPEKPVQLEFPAEAPPAQEMNERSIDEDLRPTLIEKPPRDVSLGQVLHVPTMDELEVNGRPASAATTLVADLPEVKPQPSPPPAAPTIKATSQAAAPSPSRTTPPITTPHGPMFPPVTETKSRLEPPAFVTKKKDKSRKPLFPLTAGNRNRSRILALTMILIAFGLAGWVYYDRATPVAVDQPLKITSTPVATPALPNPKATTAPIEATDPVAPQPSAIKEEPPKTAPLPDPNSPLTMARMGKLSSAALTWRQQLSTNRKRFTIQLEIACQEKTVMEALQLMEYSQDIMIIPIDFKGRSCYRVLYGIFPTTSQGRSARTQLPSVFLNQPSPPQVVSIMRILQ